MKPLNINFPFTVYDLLNYFDKLDTRDLQGITDKLTNLISKRNNPTPEERDTSLLAIINKKLPTTFLQRFNILKAKMEVGDIDKSELLEMNAYVKEIEIFDNELN